MSPRPESIRCKACGKILKNDDKIIRVSEGTLKLGKPPETKTKVEESGVWGHMHERCYLLAIRDPRAIAMLV
jgi:hypothetical protein